MRAVLSMTSIVFLGATTLARSFFVHKLVVINGCKPSHMLDLRLAGGVVGGAVGAGPPSSSWSLIESRDLSPFSKEKVRVFKQSIIMN